MDGLLSSRRKALMMTVAWWYVRRLVRKRGTAVVAGLIAGEGLSRGGSRPKRHRLRWVVLLTLATAGGYLLWRRRQSGDDGWGGWEPAGPVAEPPEPDIIPALGPDAA